MTQTNTASPDLLIGQLAIQSQLAFAALSSLVAGIKASGPIDTLTNQLAQAEQILAAAPSANPGGDAVADFAPVVLAVGPHSGWRIKNAIEEAFLAGLKQELQQLLPTVKSMQCDHEMEHGDEGQYYASFSFVQVQFQDGTIHDFSRDYDADDEFSLKDSDEHIRCDLDGLDEEERKESEQAIAKYAALFGVDPTQEAVGNCLDHISNYIASYYEHSRRDGGLDVIYQP